LNRMEQEASIYGETDWKPGIDSYNILLKALSHENVHDGAIQAEQILYDLIKRWKKNRHTEDVIHSILPTVQSFCYVLVAYRHAAKKVDGVVYKVEKLLEIHSGLLQLCQRDYGAGAAGTTTATSVNEDMLRALQPTTKLYNAALSVMSHSRDTKKAIRANKIVQQMKYSQPFPTLPTLYTYKCLLNCCAYLTVHGPKQATAQEKYQSFQIAVDALHDLRSSGSLLSPDATIYSLFLKSCMQLMPSNRKRDAVIEAVFNQCCRDGVVDQRIIQQLKVGTSTEMYQTLLGNHMMNIDVPLPSDWTRNVGTSTTANNQTNGMRQIV
jgi:hypothetical protein